MVLGVPIFNHFRVSDQTIVMQAYLSKFEGECVGWGRGGVGGGGGREVFVVAALPPSMDFDNEKRPRLMTWWSGE